MTTTTSIAAALSSLASTDPILALTIVAVPIAGVAWLVAISLEAVRANEEAGREGGFMLALARVLSWPARVMAGNR